MAGIKEVAQRAGVSIATVSNVYNDSMKVKDATKAKVLLAAEELNYNCANGEEGKKKSPIKLIGVIIENITEFNTPPIVDAIAKTAKNLGWDYIMVNLGVARDNNGFDYLTCAQEAQSAMNILLSKDVEAIAYVAGHCRPILNLETGYSVPIVYAYCNGSHKDSISVRYDNGKVCYKLTKSIIEQGHKNIGIIAGMEDNLHVQERLVGVQKAHFDGGILYNPRNLVRGDWDDSRSGYIGIQKLLDQGISTVFCLNDTIAVGVYQYAGEHNIQIPEQLSVVGFDNLVFAQHLYPPLTTVELPLRQIGIETVNSIEKLLLRREKNCPHEHIILDCNIIERGSLCQRKRK